jgi:hypothetical protein
VSCCFLSKADEGMWIPLFLKYNEAEMQQLGFKLTVEDIYSVNHHSMKDAIMLFGGGCTGELISPDGMLMTNHHCGYSYVASYSTVENNILHNGFWASKREDEIPVQGLSVIFLVRMEEVTEPVLKGVTDDMTEEKRDEIIQANIKKLITEAVEGTHYTAIIKPFYYGNQYFMFVNETFKDVRLVGVPPESIGKFGGDTDNWMWPRHTGDFSLYRIYADKNGKPAEYSKDNVPMKSKKFFNLSVQGVEENDFTLVFGYPGTTRQFLTSDGVEVITASQNPVTIHQRGIRLDVMKKYMGESLEIRLMYSGKANSISNGWKKYIGENKGLEETKAIDKKKTKEREFMQWVTANREREKAYGSVLDNLSKFYTEYKPLVSANTYFIETIHAIEMCRFFYTHVAPYIEAAENKDVTTEKWKEYQNNLTVKTDNFFDNYYKTIDKELFVELLYYSFNTIDPRLIPNDLQRYTNISKKTLSSLTDEIYEKSIFSNKETFKKWIGKAGKKEFLSLKKSLLYQIVVPSYQHHFEITKKMEMIESQIKTCYRTYVKALMEKEKESKTFYPDANTTMRVTYGQVKGFAPYDGMEYVHYTTLKGVIEKENPDIFDYKVNAKLKELYETGNYGRYANTKGELPIAFIASNHTTGGNSGSPVVNANGDLIGVNFDRVWEGTMSDINYDVKRCRNISVDVRYVLFIIDKFANAQNIINELNIVE